MTTLGTALLRIDVDEAGVDKGFANVKQKAEGLGHTMSTALGSATGFLAAQAGQAAMSQGFSLLIGNAMNFEKSLNGVAASTGATTEQMAAMRKEALQIGADTSKSASEAVVAMGELAKAGMSIDTILAGAGRSAVQLSEATGVAVPTAAVLMSNAMNVFSKDGMTAAQVADLLAQTAVASAIDVNDLGLAMAAGGTSAAAAGLSMNDFATAIGIMGNQGIRGSDAGTSMKSMLAGLTPVTDKAVGSMKALGFSAFDAQGNFKSMPDIIANLQKSMAGLTEEQKASTLEMWFGSDGIRAATILLNQGTVGWDKFTAAVAQSPTVAEQSKKRMEGLAGSIEILKGSIETVSIVFGTLFLGLLAKGVTLITEAVNAVLPLVAALLSFEGTKAVLDGLGASFDFITGHTETMIVAITAATIVIAPFAIALAVTMVGALYSAIAALVAFTVAWVIAFAPLVAIGVAIGLVVLAIYELYKNFDMLKAKAKEVWDSIGLYVQIGVALATLPFAILAFAIYKLITQWDEIKAAVRGAWADIKSTISSAVDTIISQLTARNLGKVVGDILFAPVRLLRFMIEDAIPAIVEAATSLVKAAGKAIESGLTTAGEAVKTFFSQTVPNFISNTIPTAVSAAASLGGKAIDSLWAGIKSAWETAKSGPGSLVALLAQLWLDIESKAKDFEEIGKRIVQGIARGIVGLFGWIKDQVTSFVNGLVQAAESAAGTHSPSTKGIYIGEMFVAGIAQGLASMRNLSMPTLMAPMMDTGTYMEELVNGVWQRASDDVAGTAFRESSPGGGGGSGEVFRLVIELDGAVIHESEQRRQGNELRLRARGMT